ncbi:MAG: hypothetical protein VB858_04495, partial [Planctomycetaceae bacterium]
AAEATAARVGLTISELTKEGTSDWHHKHPQYSIQPQADGLSPTPTLFPLSSNRSVTLSHSPGTLLNWTQLNWTQPNNPFPIHPGEER